jgi:hypothetical protein
MFLKKSFQILFFGLAFTSLAYSQGKNDFNWILGVKGNNPTLTYGGDLFSFSTGEIDVLFFELELDMWYPNVISDENGQMAYYTNACEIRDRNHQLIENGDQINEGTAYTQYCGFADYPMGYPIYQGQISLPSPMDNGIYYYFHLRKDELLNPLELLYTQIDMNMNQGDGKVISKNQLLLQDTLSSSIVATKHANGRDWWIVLSRQLLSKYYVYLLDPKGLHGPYIQQPDSAWITGQVITLMCNFSPDGTKFLRTGSKEPADFRLYDFDRCTGTLSNGRDIKVPEASNYAPWGCFSPNSRFLYVQNLGRRLYQYDTWASDISASATIVGEYDGFVSMFNLGTFFNSMLLAPDQKIYISTSNGTNFLHTIHRPDEPGLACDFRQHDVVLPALYSFWLPNMPFYRLYNLAGSACDTLGVQPPLVAFWRSEPDTLALEVAFTDISYVEPVQWYWEFGDGATSTLASPSHIYPQQGTYEVCLTVCDAAGACDDFCKPVNVTWTSGSAEPGLGTNPVSLFPNPASDFINLSFREPLSTNVDFMLMDALGCTVLTERLHARSDFFTVATANLPSGLYYYSVTSEKEIIFTGKLILQQ